MTRFLPIALLVACGAAEKPPVEPDPTEAVVHAAPVETKTEPTEFPGVVTTKTAQVLIADFAGPVERLFVHAGSRVKAGDPIAKLDDREMRQSVAAAREQERGARNDAGSAGAQAANARQKLRVETKLAQRGISPLQQVRAAQAELNALSATAGAHSARAQGLRAERERLEMQLAHSTITAPFDGVVMMIKVKEGEATQKGTPIARMFDPRDLMMRFVVPKDQRTRVQLGQRVELHIDGVPRPIWATVQRITDEEPPINFAVVEADIDDGKLAPDEIRVTAQGRVRIADAPAGGKR
jgi:RND family efflux transporter MFP subunit